MKVFRRLAGLLLVGACPAPAAPPVVYPTPQQCELSEQVTQVQRVDVHRRKPGATGGMWTKLPSDKPGAYAVTITPERAEVWANDDDGEFYAKQTISQLLQGVPGADTAQRDPYPEQNVTQVAKLGKLHLGTVIDWPDLPFRGVVEGYYGIPWSAEARCSLFDFYGRNKMNTYIYAPKDDPYHHGGGCYKPYPPERAAELKRLVENARKNHVRFVWAIHPANTVHWQDNEGKTQLDALCQKLQHIYELGVRAFGVLVDDSAGEIGKPERQVQLCNYLTEHFIRTHPDVNQTLIMCPTGYNRSWTNPGFLRRLGQGLEPSTCVMWTGDTVVHDITLAGQRWVREQLGRPTFIWWNWPCNDFKSGRLSMGRAYGMGQEREMLKLMSGFVANPMQQAEANKVGLFGVADYTWNVTRFHSEQSWKDGIARLYPAHQKAMLLFCEHNSYLLPNNHGYDREESVRITPVAEQFLRSLAEGKPDAKAAAKLREEFKNMERAGRELREGEPTLAATIEPWLRQFERVGRVGQLALDASDAKTSAGAHLTSLLEVGKVLDEMSRQTRDGWNGHAVIPATDVEVASRVMTPLLRQVYRTANQQVFAQITKRPAAEPVFTTNRGNAQNNAVALFDNDPRSFWANGARQQAGDWLCLDFGERQDIRRICLRMGGPRANDYPESGQFEFSQDGESWQPAGVESHGADATLNLTAAPQRARYVRFRITRARENWLCVYEFSVNRMPLPTAKFGGGDTPALTTAMTGGAVIINRVPEVHQLPKNAAIELKLPGSLVLREVRVNLDDPELAAWGRLEITTEGGTTRAVKLTPEKDGTFLAAQLGEEPLSSVRLVNTGNPRSVRINRFEAQVAEGLGQGEAELLTDGDLSTAIDCDKARSIRIPCPPGAKKVMVVVQGDDTECELKGCKSLGVKKGSCVRNFMLTGKEKVLELRFPRQKGHSIHEVIFK